MFSLNRAAHVPCLLVAGLLCLASALPVVAQTAHEHEHTGPAVANLQLDGGQKWQTDAALRSGMAAIRSAFDADHPALHAGRETDAQYAVAKEKCDSFSGAAKDNCLSQAKAQFGK